MGMEAHSLDSTCSIALVTRKNRASRVAVPQPPAYSANERFYVKGPKLGYMTCFADTPEPVRHPPPLH